MLTVTQCYIGTVVAALVIFFTRATPFIFFNKSRPTPIMSYLQTYIPPMTMVILVMYSVKDVQWGVQPYGVPSLVGIVTTLVLHLKLNNPLISIFGATAVYMFLSRVM